MSSFTAPLELEYLDGHLWKLTAAFGYYTGDSQEAPGSYLITIPAGFITDFASIPRALWAVLPPTGDYGKAAVVHDWLYRHGGLIPGCPHVFSRSEADAILRNASGVLGVGALTRGVMWLGVRLGGHWSWKSR